MHVTALHPERWYGISTDDARSPPGIHQHGRAMSSARTPTARRAGTAQSARTVPPASPTLGSATCPQCRNVQAAFYCTVCLSERLILQHADHRRLGEAKQRAKSRVEALLGPTSSQQMLDDPFVEPENSGLRTASSHHGASNQDRTARAVRARLQAEVAQQRGSAQTARKAAIEGRHKVAAKRLDVARRRNLLGKAVKAMRGDGTAEAGRRATEPVLSHQKITSLTNLVVNLQVEGQQVAGEVARARARLAHDAFALFDVRAPSSSLAGARSSADGSKSASASRAQRSRERYTTGAFAIDFANAFDLGKNFRETRAKEEVRNINDWTILGLVLPLPSDVKRFDREEVNGAISHTVQLMQLVTTYLGITLPFVVSMQADQPQIRANPLWGSGVKESLHLSTSTHSALVATANIAPGMGASMMSNLGASTLSTLESFVQLPSGKGLPWAKNLAETPSKSGGGDTSGRGEEVATEDARTLGVRRFYSALTMLSYNVSYLAHLQGIKVDLVLAAGSILRQLSKALQSPGLGKRSHATYHTPSNISDLQFPSVDFAQLLQVHEPGFHRASDVQKRLGSKAIMEGSYVDAKAAFDSQQHRTTKVATPAPAVVSAPVETPAASRSSKTALRTVAATSSLAVKPGKMSSLAAKRVPATMPLAKTPTSSLSKETSPSVASPSPNTLDFLRARGEREPKNSLSPVKADRKERPQKPSGDDNVGAMASGTITFNGREIKGKLKSARSDRPRDDDDWDVL